MTRNEESFLRLIKFGIGHYSETLPQAIGWWDIKKIADHQGLTAIALDGIEKLPGGIRPSKELSLQWIGEVLQNYENRYESYRSTIAEMAGFYNSHGFEMMVLKGYACSLNWPKPEHRPCGDIDIWLFGKQKEADAILEQEKGIKIDNSHHHHTVFYWRDFMVENHYDFINVHHHNSNRELEEILKELGRDASNIIEVCGEKVYLPSPNLHALFLLRHAMNHFASSEITIRQLMDWAFFVEKHGKDMDWEWFENLVEHFEMKKLYDSFNAICVEELGFDVKIFPCVQFDPDLKSRVLKEILRPEYSNELPSNLFLRVLYKYHRWRANAWKRDLCYKETRWETFWSHILRAQSL